MVPPQRRQFARRRRQLKIDQKAEALLRMVLTPDQWLEYRRFGSVRLRIGELVYEVGAGWAGNLAEFDLQGKLKRRLCVHAPPDYPVGDRIATLILGLKDNPGRVLGLANDHGLPSEHETRRWELRRMHRNHLPKVSLQ